MKLQVTSGQEKVDDLLTREVNRNSLLERDIEVLYESKINLDKGVGGRQSKERPVPGVLDEGVGKKGPRH